MHRYLSDTVFLRFLDTCSALLRYVVAIPAITTCDTIDDLSYCLLIFNVIKMTDSGIEATVRTKNGLGIHRETGGKHEAEESRKKQTQERIRSRAVVNCPGYSRGQKIKNAVNGSI